jgi:hypothetical protein
MRRLILALLFIALFASVGLSQGAPPITFVEADGSPKKTAPTKIIVSNGTLSCSGSTCTITTGGGSVGGADTQLLYNNAGASGGITGATSDGTNVTFGSANLRATNPRITTGILDSGGNGMFTFTATGSAVNGFGFTNAATAGSPLFSAVGTDTDIPLTVSPKGSGRLESTGPLRLSGTVSDTFTTPASSSVPTKINIPFYDPGNFGQIVAMGVGDVGDNRRVMSLLDARTAPHQPTLAVFAPNENNLFGPTWEGSNSEVTLKTTVPRGVVRVSDGSSPAQLVVAPAGVSSAAFLFVHADANTIPAFQVDSHSSPTIDWARFTNNGTVTTGNYAGVSSGGYMFDVGIKRVATQFDKTSDTTLANITGLSVNVIAGKSYKFESILYTTSNVAGGVKFAIAGTATATAIIYEAIVTDAAALSAQTRATTLASAVGGVTAVTAAYCRITGTITVDAAGTLTTQFAQNASNGTASSVLVGSTFTVNEIP